MTKNGEKLLQVVVCWAWLSLPFPAHLLFDLAHVVAALPPALCSMAVRYPESG